VVETWPNHAGQGARERAERNRSTKNERREQARQERKRQGTEAARQRSRRTLRSALVTGLVVMVTGAVLFQAFTGGPTNIAETILISTSDADGAFDAAGCDVVAHQDPLPDRGHFDANQQPPLDGIYPGVRPAHSGPHSSGLHPITAAASSQISEFATTHNLEHGSVVVWWDPEQVDGADARAIGTWAEVLNSNGFRSDHRGAGILTAPYEEPGISSGKAIALRAWGTAWDCDAWDETVGHAFVIEHYGTQGIGPERNLAPYPSDILAFDDDGSTDPADEAGDGDLGQGDDAALDEDRRG
jgi:hypothetical protein